MKKFLSILIIPIMAMMVLFGCKKDDVSSLQDSKDLYLKMIDEYVVVKSENDSVNYMFKNNKKKYDEVHEDTVEDHENVMYVVFGEPGGSLDNAVTASSASPSGSVRGKLYQYTSVYQSVLSCIFEYYDRWQKDFYSSLSNVKVSQEYINELYYQTKDLKKAVSNFYEKKIGFEEEISLFGLESDLIKESINTFNYQYNKLIKQSFSFIDKFIEIQNKYFPKDDTKEYYGEMIYGQATINLAKAVFYANVVSVESGEYCNIEHLAITQANGEDLEGNSFGKAMYGKDGIISITDGNVSVKKCAIKEVGEEFTNQVRALATTSKNMQQQFNIYMKAYNSFPIYEYKCMKFGLGAYSSSYDKNIKTETEFRHGLSFEDKARENIIYQFEVVTLSAYAAKVHSFVAAN